MKHTPTPWKVGGKNNNLIYGRKNVGTEEAEELPPDVDVENAAFVVRAVNSHDALVAALEGMLARFGHDNWRSVHDVAAVNEARAALALAKANSETKGTR